VEDALLLLYHGSNNICNEVISIKPANFDWELFFMGVLLILAAMISFSHKYREYLFWPYGFRGVKNKLENV
jgi:hypothetical protein